MRLTSYLTLSALLLASTAALAQDKAPATRTLNVKLHYTGSGAVDDKHHIIVFLFDSPDFIKGGSMPISGKDTTSKDGTVTFTDLGTSPVYASAVYDPNGEYDGQSGPPPSGSSLGLYSKDPGQPAAVNIEPGKTADIELSFDDTAKMP
jgi:hypothetical protein